MADAKIRFSIGALFSGEGFQKANDAIKTTANHTKEAAGRVGQFAGQLAVGDTAAAKMAGQLGNVVSAFAMMGPAGGVVALASAAMAVYKEKVDAACQKLKEMRAYADKMFEQTLAEKLSGVQKMLEGVSRQAGFAAQAFEQMAAASAKLADAKSATSSAAGGTALAQMAWDKLSEMLAAEDEASRKLVEAKWDLAIAEKKAAVDNAAANDAIAAASRDLETAVKRRAATSDTVAAAEQALAKARLDLAEAEGLKYNGREAEYKKFEAQLKAAEDAHAKAVLAASVAATNVQVSEEKLAQATEKAEQTRLGGTAEVAKLADAEKRLVEQTEKEIQERKDAAEKERQSAENKRTLRDEANAAERGLREMAEKQIAFLDKIIEECDENIAAVREARERAKAGMAADAQHTNGSFGPYVYTLDRAGNIVDFEDFRRSLRFAERAARDTGNIDKRNARLEKEMEKIRALGKNALPSAKKRLEDWDKFRKQAEGELEAQKRKEEAEKKRDEVLRHLDEWVRDIRDNLKTALEVA